MNIFTAYGMLMDADWLRAKIYTGKRKNENGNLKCKSAFFSL